MRKARIAVRLLTLPVDTAGLADDELTWEVDGASLLSSDARDSLKAYFEKVDQNLLVASHSFGGV